MGRQEDCWLCATCAVQTSVRASQPPPESCPICTDERQYVRSTGQEWTTPSELGKTHKSVVKEEEPGLLGIGIEPPVGIGQRSLLIKTDKGNILWDCIPYLDDAAKAAIRKEGGVRAIALSHPHFLGACIDISNEFKAPIYMSEKDKEWIGRPGEQYHLFSEPEVELFGGAKIVNVGGHFRGSSILWWQAPDGSKVIATGDTVQVIPAEGWVSFMRSYPNLIPLCATAVEGIKNRLEPLDFDRLYAGWWGRAVKSDAHDVVMRSADRYIGILRETVKVEYF